MLLYYGSNGTTVSVRMSTSNIQETLATIEQEYKTLFPDNPFNYNFMDEFFAQQYQSDRQFGQIFTTFSLIAILIACLGLFGLASFTLDQRVKEIGIRKVLGARISSILLLLYKDYMVLIFLAAVLVVPVVYFALNQWLEDFAYRIDITSDLFLLPILILTMITFLTITYQSFRAAIINPTASLRKE